MKARLATRSPGRTGRHRPGCREPIPPRRRGSRGHPSSPATSRAGRPGRADAELALPIGDADGGPARGGRVPTSARVVDDDDAGTATRLTARPRNPTPVDRPVYKVRRYDTLRSIARDALGDARRADEIYEINREVIADPTRLIPGQLLELPEDADTRRVTSRDRSRGS